MTNAALPPDDAEPPPVRLPEPARTNTDPPDAAEVDFLTRGVLCAVAPNGAPTEFQRLLITAAFAALAGHAPRVNPAPISPHEFALGLEQRNEAFRHRMVHAMILGALILRPLPQDVADRVRAFARAMSIDDDMLDVTERFAHGDLGLASIDFARNGYVADWSPERSQALHTSEALRDAWEFSVHDDALTARWTALGELPAGTLGRRMFEFYCARGFEFPGAPGSAPPLLAQHDWVHVLADYGTRVESELEVFAFISRANDDPRGFSLFAMVVSLFETGYLDAGAGLFEAFPGQLSQAGTAVRVADAMRRGALSHGLHGAPDVDFLTVDWFELADRPVAELRDAFGIVAKSDGALRSGSCGPWEPGGISEFQDGAGRDAAIRAGRDYEAFGASPH